MDIPVALEQYCSRSIQSDAVTSAARQGAATDVAIDADTSDARQGAATDNPMQAPAERTFVFTEHSLHAADDVA